MAKSSYLSDEVLRGLIDMFGPKEITDPFFGPLRFSWDHRHPMKWKGSIYFNPTKDQIDIYVGSSAQEVPTEKEREFYREIESKYRELEKVITEDLFTFLRKERVDVRREDVWQEFNLYALEIPNCSRMSIVRYWSLSYRCASRGGDFVVHMSDWRKYQLSVNGQPQSNNGINPTATT